MKLLTSANMGILPSLLILQAPLPRLEGPFAVLVALSERAVVGSGASSVKWSMVKGLMMKDWCQLEGAPKKQCGVWDVGKVGK